MYPYGGGSGGNQAPPGYGGYPSQGPPGMGPPPGMGAPPGGQVPFSISPPPGIGNAQSPDPGQQSGFSTNFQASSNMPNVNLAAPIIRLGSGATGKPGTPGKPAGGATNGLPDRRPGLGMDTSRVVAAPSTAVVPLAAPSEDDVLRTIFIQNVGVKTPDAIIERVLRSAGNLRRFIRATDADNKPKDFGFAEYSDWDSFGTAIEVLKAVEIKIPKQKKDTSQPFEIINLEVVVDSKSTEQLAEETSGLSEESKQSRIDAAMNRLDATLDDIANPNVASDDTVMYDAAGQDGEIVTIPLSADDELADIPAELRETVAAEITAFRERSNRRDLERMKREEEMEEMERNRTNSRMNRLGSPPNGPSGVNGIPSGPRDRNTVSSKGGSQLPKDYQKGVNFVNDINGEQYSRTREEEESDASDGEIERRRNERKNAQEEKAYLDQERRWLNREKSRAAAVDRERGRDEDDAERQTRDREIIAKKLREWDDDAESTRKTEDYYGDHSSWARSRQSTRAREADADNKDRLAEEAERNEQKESARDFADSFLDKQAQELSTVPRESRKIQLSLGAAAQKAHAAAQPRRTMAEVEGLLEDEEEAQPTTKRTLIPIQFDRIAEAQSLTPEEREQAVRQLANDIPTDQAGLWNWDINWKTLTEDVITEKLKPFVEKKIMEYLGVQEQMLVDLVEEHLRNHKGAAELVSELEVALDEEAEVLVRKLWRMVIFFSESEKRGLSA